MLAPRSLSGSGEAGRPGRCGRAPASGGSRGAFGGRRGSAQRPRAGGRCRRAAGGRRGGGGSPVLALPTAMPAGPLYPCSGPQPREVGPAGFSPPAELVSPPAGWLSPAGRRFSPPAGPACRPAGFPSPVGRLNLNFSPPAGSASSPPAGRPAFFLRPADLACPRPAGRQAGFLPSTGRLGFPPPACRLPPAGRPASGSSNSAAAAAHHVISRVRRSAGWAVPERFCLDNCCREMKFLTARGGVGGRFSLPHSAMERWTGPERLEGPSVWTGAPGRRAAHRPRVAPGYSDSDTTTKIPRLGYEYATRIPRLGYRDSDTVTRISRFEYETRIRD